MMNSSIMAKSKMVDQMVKEFWLTKMETNLLVTLKMEILSLGPKLFSLDPLKKVNLKMVNYMAKELKETHPITGVSGKEISRME